MGKLVFNSVMKRWMNCYDDEINKEYTPSQAFQEGYDDPTYMTFKIEFGDWGASVLSRSQIHPGTTSFVAAKNNYDALPIGLLNCPYPGTPDANAFWQLDANNDSTVFNDDAQYSAFKYLRSRNEDTRAEYLYYFVNGLFEIQRDYPYIFKKISGLDSLENFDPKFGQRLKNDTKITVECFEGLNLKIRTLMEFYRKAAWDDVYQKWILPENMRQFKMVIYVFERRTFQHVKSYTDSNKSKYTVMAYNNLNADIPVKAYECCPCEFDIAGSQSWKGDYANDFSNGEETSKIVINVKNVKTYFKNGLLNTKLGDSYVNNGDDNLYGKISELMIYDLVEGIERTNAGFDNNIDYESDKVYSKIGNSTVNGVRALFLDKTILQENEDANDKLKFYIWGKSTGGAFSKEWFENEQILQDAQCKAEDQLYGYSLQYDYSRIFDQGIRSAAIDDIKMQIRDLNMPNLRGGWVSVLVNAPTYDHGKSFWRNLVEHAEETMFGARRQVLLSGSQFAINMDSWNNTMNWLYYDSPYVSTAIDRPSDIIGLLPPKFHATKVKDVSLSDRTISHNPFEQLDNPRTVPGQTYSTLSPERPAVVQVMSEMDEPRVVPTQTYGVMDPIRDPVPQEMQQLGEGREIPEQEYNTLNPGRIVPDQEFPEMNPPRNIPEQSFNELSDLREIPDQDYNTLGNGRAIPEQEYAKLGEGRDIPDQEYAKLGNGRNIPEQTYSKLGNVRNVPDQKYNELNNHRQVDKHEINDLILKIRELPGFEKATLNDLRDIPEQEIINLVETAKKSKPEYKINAVELINTINKSATSNNDMKIVDLDKGNIEEEKAVMDTLKQQLETFQLLEIDESDDEQTKKKKDIANFAKIFSDNSSDIKNALADNIINMKHELKGLSEESVRDLPKMDIYVMDKETKEPAEMSMISLNDMEQLDKNMKILSLDENQLRQLSFQTLINLHKEIENRLEETKEIKGLSKIIDDKTNKEVKQQQMQEVSKKRKQKMLGLSAPREVPNRHTIIM